MRDVSAKISAPRDTSREEVDRRGLLSMVEHAVLVAMLVIIESINDTLR